MDFNDKTPNGDCIDKYDNELKHYIASYIYPYTVNYKELGRESFIQHAAMQSGIAAGSRENAIFRVLSSFVAKFCSCFIHGATTHAKSNDPDVAEMNFNDLFRTSIVVGTAPTIIAELLAYFGMEQAVESCVAYFTSACSNGPHAHIFNMSCRVFSEACSAGTVGVTTTLLSFIMQTLVQYLRNESIAIGDNIVTGLLLGVSAAICTFLIKGLIGVLVGGVIAQAITDLRLRAQKSDKSFLNYMGNTIYYAVYYYPRTFVGLFYSPLPNRKYDYEGPFSDLMACGICFELMYDASRLNGRCFCNGCILRRVRDTGRDCYNIPATEDDIIPAHEVNVIIKKFASENNISTVLIEDV